VPDEARLEQQDDGLKPATPGWFVVNVRDTAWLANEKFGYGCVFESDAAHFEQLGINVQVLLPGQPNCFYHGESQQEAILVLHGECLLLVEGQERLLRQWDFVHLPPWTEHVTVGAGDGPCAVLMVGARGPDEQLIYPVEEVAVRHGAAAKQETRSGREAYAGCPPTHPGRPDDWDALPWAREA
jgi:uncharacterized cupin superfamily protein